MQLLNAMWFDSNSEHLQLGIGNSQTANCKMANRLNANWDANLACDWAWRHTHVTSGSQIIAQGSHSSHDASYELFVNVLYENVWQV